MKKLTIVILCSLFSFNALAEDAIAFLNKTCAEWNKIGRDDSLLTKMEGKKFSLTGKFKISYHDDKISFENDKYFIYTLSSGKQTLSFQRFLKNKNEIDGVLSKSGKNMTLNVKLDTIDSIGMTSCFVGGFIADK